MTPKENKPITHGESVSLKEYFEVRLSYMEKAVKIASDLMRERMDGFPDQFVKKDEISEGLSNPRSKVEQLTEFKNKVEGMATQKSLEIVRWVAITGVLTGFGSVILGIIFRFFKV